MVLDISKSKLRVLAPNKGNSPANDYGVGAPLRSASLPPDHRLEQRVAAAISDLPPRQAAAVSNFFGLNDEFRQRGFPVNANPLKIDELLNSADQDLPPPVEQGLRALRRSSVKPEPPGSSLKLVKKSEN